MPVLNESQKQAIRKAWDSGVRDENALYAAAGLGAGYQGGSSFSAFNAPPAPPAAPVAPVGEGFVDQGGLLGAVSRAPVVSQALGAAGFIGNRLQDVGSVIGLGVEGFIPGDQPQRPYPCPRTRRRPHAFGIECHPVLSGRRHALPARRPVRTWRSPAMDVLRAIQP